MKRNTFYIFIGCVAVALLAIFWYSVELHLPFVLEIAIIIGIGALYFARRTVTDLIEDERSARITEKAAMRTLQVFWVLFCAFSVGAVMNMLYIPRFNRQQPFVRPAEVLPPEIFPPRTIGYIQLGLLCLMIFLYVGFRLYYARKYGEWETDEE
jgi:uncharacterized membrane protein